MNTCPACKYKEGADPEQRYEHVGDEEFIEIQQEFTKRESLHEPWKPTNIHLSICPKCGCVSRQW